MVGGNLLKSVVHFNKALVLRLATQIVYRSLAWASLSVYLRTLTLLIQQRLVRIFEVSERSKILIQDVSDHGVTKLGTDTVFLPGEIRFLFSDVDRIGHDFRKTSTSLVNNFISTNLDLCHV